PQHASVKAADPALSAEIHHHRPRDAAEGVERDRYRPIPSYPVDACRGLAIPAAGTPPGNYRCLSMTASPAQVVSVAIQGLIPEKVCRARRQNAINEDAHTATPVISASAIMPRVRSRLIFSISARIWRW